MTNIKPGHSNPWVYIADGDVVTYRASSLGDCICSLTAARLGEAPVPPEQYLQDIFDASTKAEDAAIATYQVRRSAKVIWQQHDALLEVDDKLRILGHIDGLDQESDEVLEVKSFSGRNFKLFDEGGLDALPNLLGVKYRWQGAIYGHALDRLVRFVIYNKDAERDEDLIIIEPAVSPESLVPMHDIIDRVNQVEEYAARDELPECDRKCSSSSFYAHVHMFQHEQAQHADEDLTDLIRRAWDLKVQLEGDPAFPDEPGLLDQFENVKGEIKKYDVGTHVAGSVSAQIINRKGSLRLSSKLVKQRHPEIWDECAEMGAPTRSVVLKRTGG